MDVVTDLFDPVRDALGGGNLTLWLVIGGVVVLWLAMKAVKMAMRLVLGSVALAMFLGTAPWAGAAIEGPAAECAANEVSESASGWQANITKRVTVESISSDAACQADGQGLSAGTAVVKLRTFYDIPFQDWEVTPDGATSNYSLPVPSSS